MIQDLRPRMLEDLGLVASLDGLTTQFSERTGVACRLDTAALDPAQEAGMAAHATCLYRVAQEALNNVAKHAQARSVRLALASGAQGQLRLTIADDGVGMSDPGQQRRGAFGLVGMRERVRAAGGVLRVVGTPGGGTTVEVVLPPADLAAAAAVA